MTTPTRRSFMLLGAAFVARPLLPDVPDVPWTLDAGDAGWVTFGEGVSSGGVVCCRSAIVVRWEKLPDLCVLVRLGEKMSFVRLGTTLNITTESLTDPASRSSVASRWRSLDARREERGVA